jgi:hypothetical protein
VVYIAALFSIIITTHIILRLCWVAAKFRTVICPHYFLLALP